jgi:urease accessory protein
MTRITGVLAAERAGSGRVVDSVILDLAQRRAPRGTFFGVDGRAYEIDLVEPVTLRMGDRLVLEDGTHIEVVAEAEPLIEVRATDLDALARIAWHLGDRHVPVEILPNRLRLRRDSAIDGLLAALGAKVVLIEAPFNPEGGAYLVGSPAGHRHGHDHGHDDHDRHDHPHDHHDHDH